MAIPQENYERRNTLLDAICDAYDEPAFKPVFVDGALVTHCNEAAISIARKLGYNGLDGMNADQIAKFMGTSPDWQAFEMVYVQRIANQGSLVFAVLSAAELQESHGHICVIRPGNVKTSGKWGFAPAAMNIGKNNFIKGGVNDAFVPKPKFFALKSTVIQTPQS